MNVIYHTDPGHGWLEVPLQTLKELGILKGMTEFSYLHGSKAFLEEDCDARVFMQKAKAAGIDLHVSEKHTDREHWIRNLERFPTPTNPAWKEAQA